MARVSTCDICAKPITEENPIVGKLYFAPVNGHKARDQHSSYSSHMDVGKCCTVTTQRLGKWQKRKKRPRVAKAA